MGMANHEPTSCKSRMVYLISITVSLNAQLRGKAETRRLLSLSVVVSKQAAPPSASFDFELD